MNKQFQDARDATVKQLIALHGDDVKLIATKAADWGYACVVKVGSKKLDEVRNKCNDLAAENKVLKDKLK